MLDDSLRNEFCESTSVPGLRYIFGSGEKLVTQVIWSAIFLLTTSLLLWQIIVAFNLYLTFDIKTSITYESNSDVLTLPAVTFCTRTVMRRSVVGGQENFLKLASLVFYQDDGANQERNRNTIRTCSKVNNSTPLSVLEDNAIGLMEEIGFVGLEKLISLTSDMCLIKCLLCNRKINCSSIAINRFTDDGMCFTVNPVKQENDLNKKIFGPLIDTGLEDKVLTTTNFGPMNGLQLLLNANQQEYCARFRNEYDGVGFNALIHDQSEAGSVHQLATMYLKVGSFYDVILQPIKHKRKTEHLGKCKSKTTLTNLNLVGNYSISACKLLCLARYIWGNCGCLVLTAINNTKTAGAILGIKVGEKDICQVKQFGCMNQWMDRFIRNDGYLCPDCVPQCMQTEYEYALLETKLTMNTLDKIFPFGENMTENPTKNYLVFNMYFGSMNEQTITESQLYKPLDLFITISNGLGLFFGMSMISLFEPLTLLMMVTQKLFSINKKWSGWKRKRSKIFFTRQNKISLKFAKSCNCELHVEELEGNEEKETRV